MLNLLQCVDAHAFVNREDPRTHCLPLSVCRYVSLSPARHGCHGRAVASERHVRCRRAVKRPAQLPARRLARSPENVHRFPDDAWTAKLAIAPGTVYGNSWEQRCGSAAGPPPRLSAHSSSSRSAQNAEELRVVPVDYTPPYPLQPGSPRAWLSFRSAGVSLGRVEVELRPDVAPLASANFAQLCEFGVYKVRAERGAACCAAAAVHLRRRRLTSCPARTQGCIFHRIFPEFIVQGGDYHQRCGVVCPPGDAESCFDLSLVPFAKGGRSIYSDRADGLFADEGLGALAHARGTVSMSNAGRPDTNGSQFFACITPPGQPPRHLDGLYTAFGQIVSGFEVLSALGGVGRKDGSTRQRVVCDGCGIVARAVGGAAGLRLAHSRARGTRRTARVLPRPSLLVAR
jgi:cyclophilin family peptidyl-prolyl cis-trans isomerase